MNFSYMIFAAVVPITLAQESIVCNLSEVTGSQRCLGVLGEPLYIYLTSRTNESEIRMTKDKTYLFLSIRNNRLLVQEFNNQSQIFPNGTFKLDIALQRHSGCYQLETFASNGALLQKVDMQLEIQAPVSEPVVSQVCVSPGEMRVSCSSEGEKLEFIWSLDNQLLMRTKTHTQFLNNWTLDNQPLARNTAVQTKPSVLTFSISLHGQMTSSLNCTVRNNVSRNETVIQLTSCKAHLTPCPKLLVVILTVALTVSVVLLVLLAVCLGINHLHKRKTSQTVSAGNSEDDVVYSDVVVMEDIRRVGQPDATVLYGDISSSRASIAVVSTDD